MNPPESPSLCSIWEYILSVSKGGGAYRSTDDLKADPVTYEKIENLIQELKAKGGMAEVERTINEMVDQYV